MDINIEKTTKTDLVKIIIRKNEEMMSLVKQLIDAQSQLIEKNNEIIELSQKNFRVCG